MKTFKLSIIADIHGILPSLEAVLADIESDPPDEIIVAGDFLGGPQPQQVLDVLQGLGCKFILGNGEINMLKMHQGTAPDEWWTHHQFDLGRWIYRQLNETVFDFLAELPQQYVVHPAGCSPMRVVHGAPWDAYKLVFPREEPDVLLRALRMIPEDVLVFAHNHLPDVIYLDGKLAVNPGSVSNNLNGDTRASYARLTCQQGKWEPRLHYVNYDLNAVVDVFKQTGFLQANGPLARAFLESILTGTNKAVDYINFAFQEAHKVGYENLTAVPDEIWVTAERSFPWQYRF